MAKISVIVPVYNCEAYITQCIESVLRQTFRDFELILVDDGSKDKSPEICERYALRDSRIKVIHKPMEEGLERQEMSVSTAPPLHLSALLIQMTGLKRICLKNYGRPSKGMTVIL